MPRNPVPALVVPLIGSLSPAFAQDDSTLYAALFRAGTTTTSFACELTWQQVASNYQRTWAPRNIRVVSIDAYGSTSDPKLCVTLQRSSEPYLIYRTQSSTDFNRYATGNARMRLVDLEVVSDGRSQTFFGIWHGSTSRQNIVHDLDALAQTTTIRIELHDGPGLPEVFGKWHLATGVLDEPVRHPFGEGKLQELQEQANRIESF